jgi:hypothetical protein
LILETEQSCYSYHGMQHTGAGQSPSNARGPLVARAARVRSLLQFLAKLTAVIPCRLCVTSEGSGLQTEWFTDHIHLGDVLHGLVDADQDLTIPRKGTEGITPLAVQSLLSREEPSFQGFQEFSQ